MLYVKRLDEMTRREFQEAGGKAANLGELARNGFNVPPGFCVTGRSLDHVLNCAGLMPVIMDHLRSVNFDDYAEVEARSAQIRAMIENAPIPPDLLEEIQLQIHALRSCAGRSTENAESGFAGKNAASVSSVVKSDDPFVAVRSSVAVRDSAISSFPGMMDTYHFIRGEGEILAHIRKCWASLYTARAVTRRHQQKIPQDKGVIAPVVQKMVDADVAGVLFTANPINGARNEMVIESNWGLGESVVSGEVNADYFVVVRDNPARIRDKRIQNKAFMVSLDRERGIGRKKYELTGARATQCTLSDGQLLELAALGERIEAVFGHPQDIEWAYEGGELFVLQSRNIKGLKI